LYREAWDVGEELKKLVPKRGDRTGRYETP
jgi:hypothetical protein